jgi:hypothetical protein
MEVGHGGHRPALAEVTALSLFFIWNQCQPSILRSTLKIRTYLFGWSFC